MTASLRLVLLGIALLLFGVTFPVALEQLILHDVLKLDSLTTYYLLGSVFPLAGIILAFIGFFKRDRA